MIQKLRDSRGRFKKKKECKDCYSYKERTINHKGISCGTCLMYGFVTYGHLTCSEWLSKQAPIKKIVERRRKHKGYNYKFKCQRIESKGRI